MHATDMHASPRHALVPTPDGAQLALTAYEPHARPRGSVLVAPAVAVPQGFYARFANFVAASGLRAVTFDYRGFGRSRRNGGPLATLSRWGEIDYPAALRWTLERSAGAPVYVVGHSLGGQYLGLADAAADIAGGATVASMSGYVGNLEHDRRRVELLFRYAVPAMTAALPEVPGWLGLGTAMPSGAMRQWARWCLSPDYFLSTHPEYRAQVARYRGPLTMLSFEDDRIAPLRNVRWLVDFYAAADPRHVHVEPARAGVSRIGHMGFFRENSRPLWGALLAQLERHDAAFELRAGPPHESALARDVRADLEYGVA